MDLRKQNKKIYDAIYRQENAERISESRKKYREANKAKIAEDMANYYLKNKEKIKVKNENKKLYL